MKNILLLGFFVTLMMPKAWSQELIDQSLILTHTSKYYHSSAESEEEVKMLIKNKKGPVFALAQHELASDGQWYGLPLNSIDFELDSRAGEHTLTFPSKIDSRFFNLTAAGGYLSSCLGRTLSNLVVSYLNSTENFTLKVNLPAKAIFTGFLSENGRLIPETPYRESILDDTIDGLNFSQVLEYVEENHLAWFLGETIELAVFQKSAVLAKHPEILFLDIQVDGRSYHTVGISNGPKKVILNFKN